jgi:FlgD Ig-like domain
VPYTPIPRLPAINFVSPVWTQGAFQGLITYEATAFDPDVDNVNGAGIDTVVMVLGYTEGDDPFGEGTTFIPMARKILTAPPYVLEVDSDTIPDESYRLLVFAISSDGKVNSAAFNHIIDNNGPSITTSVQDPDIDSERDLSLSSYPNPFMTSTTIQYLLPAADRVELSIYDISGRRVRTLIGEHKSAGAHTVDWNGFDDSGHSVDAGMYFCNLIVGTHSIVEGLVLLR